MASKLSEEQVNEIKEYIEGLHYNPSIVQQICLYLAQTMRDNDISYDNTCYILNNIHDISPIEKQIKDVYNDNTPPLAMSNLLNFISKEEYAQLSKLIKLPLANVITLDIDSNLSLKIDFEKLQVIFVKKTYKADGTINLKDTPIIEAVPHKLVVYDSPLLDLPRSFKVVWKSMLTKRLFTTAGSGSGATIKEIADYIDKQGFSHNHRFIHDAVAAMVNAMILNDLAEVKYSIDNKGVYYDEETNKLIVVKLNKNLPSKEEMLQSIDTLDSLKHFYRDNVEVFATVFKWALVSIFNYAMKQKGNHLKWLFLVGTSQSGKTTLANIMRYIYDEYVEDLSGSQMSSEYRMGDELSKSCVHLSISEPEGIFNSDNAVALLKHCIYSTISRVVQGKAYPVFSAGIITSNDDLPDKDAIFNRMVKIFFEHNQRKTHEQITAFNKKFNPTHTKKSILRHFRAFGSFAIHTVSENVEMLTWDWQDMADKIIHDFYDAAGVEFPDWLSLWKESETIDDFDNSRREDIKTILLKEISKKKESRVTIRDENGYITDLTLDDEVSSTSEDFKDLVWNMINNRMFTWCIPHQSRWMDKSVCLTQEFKKLINRELNISENLNSYSQLLNWDYSRVKINGRANTVIKVPLKEFMEFLYPELDFNVDSDDLEEV